MRSFRAGLLFLLIVPASAMAKPIATKQTSDLIFGTAFQGDLALTVPPGTSETPQNASFDITGDRNTAYTITLPVGSISMTTGGGGANRTILVSNFQSFPSEGANGLLNTAGKQILLVGATRAALATTQIPGNYTASFVITVVY